jgi:hypothetical protein
MSENSNRNLIRIAVNLGFIAIFCLMVYGFIIKNYLILFLSFPCFFIFGLIAFGISSKRSKDAMNKFSEEIAIPMIQELDKMPHIPYVFRTDRGMIPFTKMEDVILITDDFIIFNNVYWSEYMSAYDGKRTIDHEKQLSLFFTIQPIEGYHIIVLKNSSWNEASEKNYTALCWNDASHLITGNENIDKHYLILSTKESFIREAIIRIEPCLRKLIDVFPFRPLYQIEDFSLNLEIHITSKYVLVRMDRRAAELLSEIKPVFLEMKKILSY